MWLCIHAGYMCGESPPTGSINHFLSDGIILLSDNHTLNGASKISVLSGKQFTFDMCISVEELILLPHPLPFFMHTSL